MLATARSPNTTRSARQAAAVLTFVIWALLAASVLWWWLRAGSSAAPAAPVAARAQSDVDGAAVARALGANGTAAPASAPVVNTDGKFALRGVLTHGSSGAALIAVGGKVRTVRVGAPVGKDAEGWTLHEAQPHAVVLAGGGRQVRLDMPGPQEWRASQAKRAQRPARAEKPGTPERPRPPRPVPRRPAPEAEAAPEPALAPAPEPAPEPAAPVE
ncbi:MAG: hypothetical protein IJR28_04690 [Ottowia sp.]|nr:hypothetical protein [Ottowia sp.]